MDNAYLEAKTKEKSILLQKENLVILKDIFYLQKKYSMDSEVQDLDGMKD